MNKDTFDANFDTTEITLRYMARSVYQENSDKKLNRKRISDEDKDFYKKRVKSYINEMLLDAYPSEHLKEMHEQYMYEIINYIKIQDRVDILQREYSNIELSIKESPPKNELLIEEEIYTRDNISVVDDANIKMLRRKSTPYENLGKYINVKPTKPMEKSAPPLQKDLNIKTEEHRTKGINNMDMENTILETVIEVEEVSSGEDEEYRVITF
jgi:hypothetical protein